MRPVFDADAIARTRRHFIDRVSGRGAIPAVRIGKQPYGILPSCALSRMNWMEAAPGGPVIRGVNGSDRFLVVLRDLLRALARDFWDGFVTKTPRVGKAAANPQQQLLDILALHASSVDFHLNVLDSAERLWNEGGFYFTNRARLEQSMRDQMSAGVQLLASLGYHGPQPEIVSKFYSHVHGPMKRPTIDAPPLSETAELTKCTVDQKNYLEWCREKAQSAFEDLRLARGFSEGKTPDAVLYHVLRHALELGYHKSAVDLHLNGGLLTVAKLDEVYREPPFVHVADRPSGARSESRYRPLYAKEASITGSPARSVAEFIPSWLTGAGQDGVLADQLAAIGVLEHALHGRARARVCRAHRPLRLPVGRLGAESRERAAAPDAAPRGRRRRSPEGAVPRRVRMDRGPEARCAALRSPRCPTRRPPCSPGPGSLPCCETPKTAGTCSRPRSTTPSRPRCSATDTSATPRPSFPTSSPSTCRPPACAWRCSSSRASATGSHWGRCSGTSSSGGSTIGTRTRRWIASSSRSGRHSRSRRSTSWIRSTPPRTPPRSSTSKPATCATASC